MARITTRAAFQREVLKGIERLVAESDFGAMGEPVRIEVLFSRPVPEAPLGVGNLSIKIREKWSNWPAALKSG
jgi:hypothetical protein